MRALAVSFARRSPSQVLSISLALAALGWLCLGLIGCGPMPKQTPAGAADAGGLVFLDGGSQDQGHSHTDQSSTDHGSTDTPTPPQPPHDDHNEYNCLPIECVTPPASVCLDQKRLRTFGAKGACHPVDDKCVYEPKEIVCEGVCHNGQCYKPNDPCIGLTCKTPPATKCIDAKTRRSYAPSGTCSGGACQYKHADLACPYGCKSGKCQAAPPDPCAGVTCKKPPAPKCISGSKLRTYYPSGKCSSGKCSYSYSDQSCPHGCANNRCRAGAGFSAVQPFRFLDTRGASPLATKGTRCFQITGKGGVPSSARAVYVNVVAVAPAAAGFLTAFPKGISVPNTSTLNYTAGQTIANGAIVKIGSSGQICLYSLTRTDAVVDVYGFFDADADFFPKGPYRRVDTRTSTAFGAKTTRCYQIGGRDGIPSSAKAVFANLVAVQPSAIGHLTAYPKGDKRPPTSNLNFAAGQTTAGGSILELGDGGQICVYSLVKTHLVIDVSGFFGDNSSFVPMQAVRATDTRNKSKPGAKATRCYKIAGAFGIPSDARAVAFNIAAVKADGPGYLAIFPESLKNPNTSILNYQPGIARTNNALVQTGSTGRICVYNSQAVDYILDIVGYWKKSQAGDPCAGITCNNPPAPLCVGGNTIASYSSSGTCKEGVCVYKLNQKICSYKCSNAKCVAAPPKPTPPPSPYTFHPVTSWQTPQDPVRSGSTMNILALRYITIHYNGGTYRPNGSDGVYQDSDFAQFLRSSQRDYIVHRGYSLGYNSAIAPDGDEWEIRGLRYRAAANGCTKVNSPAYTIFVPVRTVSSPPTAAQVKGVNAVIARIRAAAKAAGNPHHLTINGHRDVRPLCGNGGTACPGNSLYSMIQSGAIGPK